ncbi:hypothetical protein [Corynebacterium cystitidis]|uniref:Uncharacterized protein n=1 Tax=Corynebacterium cystitidis DSM 20524 TaxID=1121357 RepID=A0A1H9WKF9_9CORY|nr:hypothetical protein [Corynebacterium cystitidis]WJY83428.1 hypothetical protein CCYS_12705 [Corynebacterium cystitidis DSM 20524]SES34344.1 hypothetical protein SAMN05661109_02784 [Corynebacterium cystitidis DSM 20524]SNV61731.1 Uncharacterised protein [Corynebacterium cystitidis]
MTRLARQNSWGLAFVDSAEVVLFGDESEDVETATSVQTYPWGSKLGVGERLRLAQRREIIANPDQDPRIQEGFVVITDTSRSAHGDFYIQARYLAVDDVWIVETRKGNAQQHYGREVQDRDIVITIFRQWLETGDVSADENDWRKVEL